MPVCRCRIATRVVWTLDGYHNSQRQTFRFSHFFQCSPKSSFAVSCFGFSHVLFVCSPFFRMPLPRTTSHRFPRRCMLPHSSPVILWGGAMTAFDLTICSCAKEKDSGEPTTLSPNLASLLLWRNCQFPFCVEGGRISPIFFCL